MPPQPRHGLVDAAAMPRYDLGAGHPFARDRQEPLFDLIRRMELAEAGEFLTPVSGDRQLIELAHDPEYVDMVEATSADDPDPLVRAGGLRFGLGSADNPLAPGQHQAASAVAGATADCVRRVVRGELRHAFNPTGGLHHAAHRTASGFCIYNDLAVGIRTARNLGMERVMYVDFDVHHGDGVEFAFADDASVATVSFHQSPETLFPGTGHEADMGHGAAQGTVVNMPFAPYTDDSSWWHCVSTVLPAITRRFRPDLIITQHGCDPHHEDPLAQLMLTTAPMQKAARLSRELAEEVCGGRWVATGGGGYQPFRVLPRAWAIVWMELNGRPLPDRVDPDWVRAWQHASNDPLVEQFLDPELPRTNAHDQARDMNLHRLDKLLNLHNL
jgi:acetoin utilization protein AcuC